MNAGANADTSSGGDDASDDEEEQRMNFMSASQVKPEHIEKLDKAVCYIPDSNDLDCIFIVSCLCSSISSRRRRSSRLLENGPTSIV